MLRAYAAGTACPGTDGAYGATRREGRAIERQLLSVLWHLSLQAYPPTRFLCHLRDTLLTPFLFLFLFYFLSFPPFFFSFFFLSLQWDAPAEEVTCPL